MTIRPVLCPTHGSVDGVEVDGVLVCPDPTCHRTCRELVHQDCRSVLAVVIENYDEIASHSLKIDRAAWDFVRTLAPDGFTEKSYDAAQWLSAVLHDPLSKPKPVPTLAPLKEEGARSDT